MGPFVFRHMPPATSSPRVSLFFLGPCFSSFPAPMQASHTIGYKGKSPRVGGWGGQTDTQSEGRSAWSLQRRRRGQTAWHQMLIDTQHTLSHTHTHTHARVICLTRSCPFHTLTCTRTYQVPLRVEGTLISVVTQASDSLVRVCACVCA